MGAQHHHTLLKTFHLLGYPPRLFGQPLDLSSCGEAHARERLSDRFLHVVALLLPCRQDLCPEIGAIIGGWPNARPMRCDLPAVLRQLRLHQAGAQSPSEITQAQIELLLVRIGVITEALRGAEPNESSRSAMRLLLADVAMVSAQFRGNTSALGERLTRMLEHTRLALESVAAEPLPPD